VLPVVVTQTISVFYQTQCGVVCTLSPSIRYSTGQLVTTTSSADSRALIVGGLVRREPVLACPSTLFMLAS